jgi:hypothetical protein
MPNHVTNELRILNQSKEKQVEIFGKILNKDNQLSFKNIVPMPESLSITAGSTTDEFVEILQGRVPKWVKYHNPEITTVDEACDLLLKRYGDRYESYLNEGRTALQNKEKYGHETWNTWCIEKWGTKWDAYDQPEDGYDLERTNVIRFQTAWSTPVGVFEALATMFENIVFEVKYADEDTGSNCGTFTFNHAGIISDDSAPDWNSLDECGQRKWRKFAFELSNPDSAPEDYGFNSNFDYIDEDEDEDEDEDDGEILNVSLLESESVSDNDNIVEDIVEDD